MSLNRAMILFAVTATLGLTACNETESANTSSTGGEESVASPSQKNTGCTVTQVANGARIECGDSSALVTNGTNGANGTNGLPGAAGPTGPVGPVGPRGLAGASVGNTFRLIDGDGTVVGDAVAGVSGEAGGTQVVVYDSNLDAMLTYNGGNLSTGSGGIFYSSTDCSGQGYLIFGNLETEPQTSSRANFVISRGQIAFKISNVVSYRNESTMKSYISSQGACVPYASILGTRVYQQADVVNLSLPVKLKKGYSVAFRP